VERGIKGTFLNTQDVLGNPLDMKGNAITVYGSAGKGLEDEKSQGSLEKVIFGFEHGAPIDSYR
jgi:hypothetical protein